METTRLVILVARLVLVPVRALAALGSSLTLSQLMPNLPDKVDPNSITLSNAPNGGDAKRLTEISSFKVSQIGLK